ncbi:hypothetical protein QYM36_011388 [Artemia franciscana]|uniref:Uncharacterized protein n=1 Tax=Artemia franciscana TaxID=6661 RepID=A0AA88HNE4_ARTSF|nr:hypothetical protein QYM36_011388 [Artemia franciscana]KAK2712685.1 hypothetical protein QYM36_011388 [Artemia franciscana]
MKNPNAGTSSMFSELDQVDTHLKEVRHNFQVLKAKFSNMKGEVGLQLLAISSCFVLSDLSESKIVLKESRQILGESDIGNSTVQQS